MAKIAGRVRALEGTGADVLAYVQKLLEAPPAAGASDELVPLTTRVSALAARLAALEEATPGAPVERLGALESSFTGLAEALAAVEAQIGGVEAAATAGADAATAVEELNSRLGALATQAAATRRLSREVDTLQARLAALDTADVVQPRALAVVLVLQQLRAAAAEGRPFADELALARQLAVGNDEITDSLTALAASAADGVATLGELRERFSAVARDLLQASLGAEADASLLDRTRARLAGVVSVRRTGAAATGDTIDAAINQAQAALDAGDLAGALAALAPYEALAAAPSAGWFAAARARLAADRAIARVDTRVFAILSQARPE